jgi:mannose-1-phosphate guanylyltransferase
MSTKRIAVIMAGGSGERFWPLSRRNRPKQLLRLADPDRNLLEQAVDRIAPLLGHENIFVATGRHLAEAVRGAKTGIPDENVIAEPCKRNTAGCLCYVAATVMSRFSESSDQISIAVLTADHQICDTRRFQETVAAALSAAEENEALVTVGIRPTRPETGYGYIEMAIDQEPAVGSTEDIEILPVVRFLEKPDRESAQRFMATGHYLWNSGMFFWRLSSFMSELRKAQPDMAAIVDAMTAALEAGDSALADQQFAQLPDKSIDYALMERASGILVAPGNFAWDDLGAWDALDRTMPSDDQGNVLVGNPVVVGCRNCVVYNEPGDAEFAVAAVGLQDVVIVVAGDGILVVPKKTAQDVKAAVAELKERGAPQL